MQQLSKLHQTTHDDTDPEPLTPRAEPLKTARRIAVGVVGGTLLVLGTVLVVTPGPGIVVFSLGLAVLAIEFAWARRWLRKLKQSAQRWRNHE